MAPDDVAYETEPFIRTRRGERRDEVVEPPQHEFFAPRGAVRLPDLCCGHTWQRREARAVQTEIDDGIEIAAIQSGADFPLVLQHPPQPRGLELGGRLPAQFRGNGRLKTGQDSVTSEYGMLVLNADESSSARAAFTGAAGRPASRTRNHTTAAIVTAAA